MTDMIGAPALGPLHGLRRQCQRYTAKTGAPTWRSERWGEEETAGFEGFLLWEDTAGSTVDRAEVVAKNAGRAQSENWTDLRIFRNVARSVGSVAAATPGSRNTNMYPMPP
jgi:hypothetical protein